MAQNEPFQEHAYSRYGRVTEGLIHALQDDYFAGQVPGPSVPDMTADEAAVIISESLGADQLWANLPEALSGSGWSDPHPGPPSDWRMATMAELFFAVAHEAENHGDRERQVDFLSYGWALLEEICKSPTASPMLDYQEIYFDIGQELRMMGDDDALNFFKQALAHDLQHNAGQDLANRLRDLAETYLWLEDIDSALKIFAALLRHDPADIWTYNVIALAFPRPGLTDLGAEAIQRGLALIEQVGDRHGLHDQLVACMEDMRQSSRQGRESEVDPDVLNRIRASLASGFDSGEGRPLAELCRELVPEVDRLRVKKPLTKVNLPPPEQWARRPTMDFAHSKPRRNDPCWCGSGKKYKHCHCRTDRQR